jgi:hypothetical protein
MVVANPRHISAGLVLLRCLEKTCYAPGVNMRGLPIFCLLLALGWAGRSDAVIFLETDDPQHHTSTPGDNSGWQYEGKFNGFLGVPIAPHFFITAKHFYGTVGDIFYFHGDSYVTIAYHPSPSTTDLMIWEVRHDKPFPVCAPLSSGVVDIGATATVFGRGTQRGAAVVVSGESKGWQWGTYDYVVRWGRNTVVNKWIDPKYGELLYCNFDNPGIADECHLSDKDSGGGLFVLEDGLWRLAGVNFTVDGPFRTGPEGTAFHAALYDMGGLQYLDGDPPVWINREEQAANIPAAFYCSRISAAMPWITSVAPEAGSLAPESYSAWQRLYFTPAQIATPTTTGPLADFDGDGIHNMLEFALNLDPIFNERATMIPNTGLRGLPAVRLESIMGNDRLTIEFVRRTSASVSGLTYIPEFSSDLLDWQAVGTETFTTINPRWERVKIVDSLTTQDSSRRFARLRVALAP